VNGIQGETLADAETVHRVKLVLRDCLKLGPNAVITDEMPLIGGDYDLDSLDILLVVTSIEKEFGIKIPNESLGRAAFASVSSLARFVDSMRGTQ
jgi:acyl carrier protein